MASGRQIGASDGLATGAPAVSAGPDAVVSEADGWIDLPVALCAGHRSGLGLLHHRQRWRFRWQRLQRRLRRRQRHPDLPPRRDDQGRADPDPRLPRRRRPGSLHPRPLLSHGGATIARAATRVLIVDNDTAAATPELFVRDATVDEKAGRALVSVLLGGPGGTGLERRRHRRLPDERRYRDRRAPTTRPRAARLPSLPARRGRRSPSRSRTTSRAERAETLTLGLSNPTGAVLGRHGNRHDRRQ